MKNWRPATGGSLNGSASRIAAVASGVAESTFILQPVAERDLLAERNRVLARDPCNGGRGIVGCGAAGRLTSSQSRATLSFASATWSAPASHETVSVPGPG